MALIRATTVSIRSHFNTGSYALHCHDSRRGWQHENTRFLNVRNVVFTANQLYRPGFLCSKDDSKRVYHEKKRVEHLTYKQCPCCHGSLIFRLYGYSHPVNYPMKPISVQGHPQYCSVTASNKIWRKPKVLDMFLDGSTWQH